MPFCGAVLLLPSGLYFLSPQYYHLGSVEQTAIHASLVAAFHPPQQTEEYYFLTHKHDYDIDYLEDLIELFPYNLKKAGVEEQHAGKTSNLYFSSLY